MSTLILDWKPFRFSRNLGFLPLYGTCQWMQPADSFQRRMPSQTPSPTSTLMNLSRSAPKRRSSLLYTRLRLYPATMSSHAGNSTAKDTAARRQEDKVPCSDCGDTEGHALLCPNSPYRRRNCWLNPLRGTGRDGRGVDEKEREKEREKGEQTKTEQETKKRDE